MFRRSPAHDTVTIYFNGSPIGARANDTVASALLAAGIQITRSTPGQGSPRGPYCMMGVCFDCLAVVDQRGSVQTCKTSVRDGMKIELQDGPSYLPVLS